LRNGSPRFVILAVALALLVSSQVFGVTHRTTRVTAQPHKRHRHYTGLLWNPMFRPTHESMVRQNDEVSQLEFSRIADDDQLEELKASEALVPIVPSDSLRIEKRLDPTRRYCRPWTRDFVEDLSRAFYARFNDQIQLNSAVRTIKVQHKLRRHNRNAAPDTGDLVSSHLSGFTVDLQRRGMTNAQIRYVEQYLFYMHELGLAEPEEERHQWVFHVMVSPRYADWRQTQTLFRTADGVEAADAAMQDASK
jgi:hypothetical protein